MAFIPMQELPAHLKDDKQVASESGSASGDETHNKLGFVSRLPEGNMIFLEEISSGVVTHGLVQI